ncbi:unnamed protein product [Allacma fusca]|uniref:Uncharacterized protein n=1 Tax=Allacma fusca TaxID=39272 RepID=A0A8J2JJ43_9HEXA|nr:unnamed protein product [Allacma fusca]
MAIEEELGEEGEDKSQQLEIEPEVLPTDKTENVLKWLQKEENHKNVSSFKQQTYRLGGKQLGLVNCATVAYVLAIAGVTVRRGSNAVSTVVANFTTTPSQVSDAVAASHLGLVGPTVPLCLQWTGDQTQEQKSFEKNGRHEGVATKVALSTGCTIRVSEQR